MLIQVTWATYWAAIGISLVLYYSFLFLVYYRQELQQTLSGKGPLALFRRGPSAAAPLVHEHPIGRGEDRQPTVDEGDPITVDERAHRLVAELQAVFTKTAVAEETRWNVQSLLRQHQLLRGTPYEEAISNMITTELKDKAGIHLSDEESRMLWG
jgi:hypothetical protein